MPHTLVRSFASLDDAQAARDCLIAGGIDGHRLSLSVIDDEAGPVEGNFIIGNGETAHGGPPGPVRSGGEVPYDENFRQTVRRGSCLLVAEVSSDSQAAQVSALLAQRDAGGP